MASGASSAPTYELIIKCNYILKKMRASYVFMNCDTNFRNIHYMSCWHNVPHKSDMSSTCHTTTYKSVLSSACHTTGCHRSTPTPLLLCPLLPPPLLWHLANWRLTSVSLSVQDASPCWTVTRTLRRTRSCPEEKRPECWSPSLLCLLSATFQSTFRMSLGK